MGNKTSASFYGLKSSYDLSSQLWTLQLSDDAAERSGQIMADDVVVERSGQVIADGITAVKIGKKRISVCRPSEVFWVGALLEKNGWIHTGVGLQNDITVEFDDGSSKTYQYLVAHGSADEELMFRIHLTFANNRSDIYRDLAHVFETNVDYSFTPVFAGGTWVTHRFAEDVVQKMECYLGRTLNMKYPGPEETNCVDFSVGMYLYFANKGKKKMKKLRMEVFGDIIFGDNKSLLRKLENELDKISS